MLLIRIFFRGLVSGPSRSATELSGAFLGLLVVFGLVGCASAHKSHLPTDLSIETADRITLSLVQALSRTEIRPTADPICIESAASAPIFERALRANLRRAGYALAQTPLRPQNADGSGSLDCLAFLGEERVMDSRAVVEDSRVGLYCLCAGGGSVCREYQLPDAKPVSSLSVAGLTYEPMPTPSVDSSPLSSLDSETVMRDEADRKSMVPLTIQLQLPYRGETLTPAHRAQLVRLANDARVAGGALVVVTGISSRPGGVGDLLLAKRRANKVATMIRRLGPAEVIIEMKVRDRVLASARDLTRGVLVQVLTGGKSGNHAQTKAREAKHEKESAVTEKAGGMEVVRRDG